jgi:hypothetical protein
MAGLDPAIYAFATTGSARRTAWITGSSPVMTTKTRDQRRHNRFLQTGQQWVKSGHSEFRPGRRITGKPGCARLNETAGVAVLLMREKPEYRAGGRVGLPASQRAEFRE